MLENISINKFQAILNALSEEASTHKKQTFSLMWVISNESMCFISAGNGELKTTLRAKKPNAQHYEYQFGEYNEFLSSFSRLEFILEQTLYLMSTEKPTIKGFIRTNSIISKLSFSMKMTLLREFQPDVFSGIFETLKRLFELRNNLAHNPVPVGTYSGSSLDSKKTLKLVESDFSQCYNHLVGTYRQHQHKLLNFIQS